MASYSYSLDRFSRTGVYLARAWLFLGIVALIGAGLLAILLVVARTPGVQNLFPSADFFQAALIVHVDLSVLIWFIAFAGVLWSLGGNGRVEVVGWLALAATVVGVALLLASPFLRETNPSLNNYVPVLQQPIFFGGLGLIALGAGLLVARALFTLRPGRFWAEPAEAVRFGLLLGAVAGAIALGAFVTSWLTQPLYTGSALYEIIFWAGGHALQFQHALLMIVAWFWLASELGAAPRVPPAVVAALFALAALPVLAVPVLYWLYPVGNWQHTEYFAHLMEYGHPLLLPAIALVAWSLLKTWKLPAPAKSALLASFVLFAAGGILAYLIHGVNVVIPAHYHGAIVGVTLAFMGLTYVLLPRIGFAEVRGRLPRWQPYIYGGGQLLHIIGLAVSGGYGVQRKAAGAAQVLTGSEKFWMGLMGLGGAIAIVGGILFVVICLLAILRKPAGTRAAAPSATSA